ncbi:hypothetical protein EKL32_00020 [Flavobacterium sp. GSN2]|nr:hypothetical protein EKL32_00020 [Flavobacterium sp. GSN2]
MLLLIGSFAGTVSAQTALKLGKNPYLINAKAALEVESITKGFLPPRMTKEKRDAITAPPAGLQLWCTNCKDAARPVVGQLCVYTGTSWIALPTITIPIVTTIGVVKSNGNTTATITGKLVDTFGNSSLESGVVYRVYTSDTDLPTLVAATGAATAPNIKIIYPGVLPDISVIVNGLNASTIYYWRTFVRTADGIGYGDAKML